LSWCRCARWPLSGHTRISHSTCVTSLLFEGGFSPEAAFAILAQEQVTNFAAAPTIYPRAVHFTDQLPKTPSGKVQRFVLKQQRLLELLSG
jgi:acyl-coenzyme A synthetase/AMP-(fatty) acid ligase